MVPPPTLLQFLPQLNTWSHRSSLIFNISKHPRWSDKALHPTLGMVWNQYVDTADDAEFSTVWQVLGLVEPDPGWQVIQVWLGVCGQVWRCSLPAIFVCMGWVVFWKGSCHARTSTLFLLLCSLVFFFFFFPISLAFCLYGKEFWMFHGFIAMGWLMWEQCWDQITHFEGKTEGASQFPLRRRDGALSHPDSSFTPSESPDLQHRRGRIPRLFLV